MQELKQKDSLSETSSPSNTGSWWEVVRFTVIALAIVVPLRFFVAQPFIVSGSSMTPTFNDGEYLIVDELSYRFKDPARGDVIVFHYPHDPSRFFIKRVIALPNETITIKDNKITITNSLHPEGFLLEESYIPSDVSSLPPSLTVPLQETQYFVMGDNRGASSDSRVWGPLDRSFIVGKAFARLFPVSEVSLRPGNVTFDK